ncbi:unnamed protein product, partial [Brassica oleracea var. botrytis]
MNVRGGIELMEWICCYWIHRCFEKVSGGDGGGGSQYHDGTETDRKKKRYHRHT